VDRIAPVSSAGIQLARAGGHRACLVVLVAENKRSHCCHFGLHGRDLNPYLGRAYLGDRAGNTGFLFGRRHAHKTTYAENMGVMAMTGVFSTHNFIAAAVIALLLGSAQSSAP